MAALVFSLSELQEKTKISNSKKHFFLSISYLILIVVTENKCMNYFTVNL